MTPMVTHFKWLAVSAVAFFSILPEFMRHFLVKWWLSDRTRLMLNSVESVLKLLTPQSLNGVFTMAYDEMKEVVHPDDEVLLVVVITNQLGSANMTYDNCERCDNQHVTIVGQRKKS